jgi:hypothetical protein
MKLFFTFLMLTGMNVCLAQGMMIPQTTTFKTPYGNANTTTYRYVPMHYGNRSASMKYQFEIVLYADSTLNTRAKIDFSDNHHRMKVKTDKGKKNLFPSDTKEIYRITPEGKRVKGISADSCWLFKTVEDKINAYAFLPEGEYTYVIAIQDGDNNPIVPLTRKNLEAIVGNPADPQVLKLIESNKLIKAVQLYNKGIN